MQAPEAEEELSHGTRVPPNPVFNGGRHGEERVYDLLEKGLHENDWFVYYSLTFHTDTRAVRTRETELIVGHPRRRLHQQRDHKEESLASCMSFAIERNSA